MTTGFITYTEAIVAVATLHFDQIERVTGDVPSIEFNERKNGPGSVSILYGMDVLDDRLVQMSERTEWNGYLFPSTQEDAEHISRQTVWRRFRDFADVADLPETIEGERPSPQLCRRFWYDRYSETLGEVIAGLEEIASEQGSSDSEVVLQNYLSEDRARRLHRESMRKKLAEAFELHNFHFNGGVDVQPMDLSKKQILALFTASLAGVWHIYLLNYGLTAEYHWTDSAYFVAVLATFGFLGSYTQMTKENRTRVGYTALGVMVVSTALPVLVEDSSINGQRFLIEQLTVVEIAQSILNFSMSVFIFCGCATVGLLLFSDSDEADSPEEDRLGLRVDEDGIPVQEQFDD